ncbi:hypothetical protein Glove_476g101 [Diversispora epigaea]|uniref:Protein kinase domain-containing protein n=1 Tax=Diversispora epigaea TaxID=1348612 RepID=A0A397GQ16_9GLOM|nr:hypothetical protein Glove_476g101 [Diversispora epigaea]
MESGDKKIDKFIQEIQLKTIKWQEIIEWIPYDRFENVTYLAKGGFGTVYKAKWLDGCILSWDNKVENWKRSQELDVCLKSLDYSTNKIDFLQEIKNQHKFRINETLTYIYITDFGLCKPITENNPENIYGVIPYMAPEILIRGEYTQASDIYSFGMVMLEILTSYPPYYNIPHNENLVNEICKGLKPEIKCEIPQFLKEIMEKCWNFDPFDRPTAAELRSQLDKYLFDDDEIKIQVNNQIQAANKSNKNFIQYDPNEMHPEAIYTSRLISKLTIPECDTFTKYNTSKNNPENIYGVIPYMAPEILIRGEYTQASDIYSFGMVMLEILTSYPPYYNIPHNENLVNEICKGLKPEIKCEIPQFLKEIMEKCWNFDPFDRPTAAELRSQLDKYLFDDDEIKIQVNNQIQAANKSNKNFIQYDPNEMHPEAIYTSRLISKLTIPECDTFTKYNTSNSRQQLFSIPDDIIVKDEENETQEMECEFPRN